MAFRLSVLGSGSGGNATLLQIEDEGITHHFLIDAGLSPKETARRLAEHDVSIQDIEGILTTHMHTDHFRDAWCKPCRTHGIHVYFHRQHARLWWKKGVYDIETTELSSRFVLTPHTLLRTFALPHDQQGSTGMLFEHGGRKLGFLTDLGHAPEGLFRIFKEIDVLAIESNYDPPLQEASPRPPYLKQRIMGERGHLSNQQSIEAVQRFQETSSLEQIILLHLSEQCNSPAMIETLYEERAPDLVSRLVFSHQREPTGWLTFVE